MSKRSCFERAAIRTTWHLCSKFSGTSAADGRSHFRITLPTISQKENYGAVGQLKAKTRGKVGHTIPGPPPDKAPPAAEPTGSVGSPAAIRSGPGCGGTLLAPETSVPCGTILS